MHAGSNFNWGGNWALDENTVIAYVVTAQPSPDFNANGSTRSNLWSDAVIAVNVTTGKFIWAFANDLA